MDQVNRTSYLRETDPRHPLTWLAEAFWARVDAAPVARIEAKAGEPPAVIGVKVLDEHNIVSRSEDGQLTIWQAARSAGSGRAVVLDLPEKASHELAGFFASEGIHSNIRAQAIQEAARMAVELQIFDADTPWSFACRLQANLLDLARDAN
jgi:hypothetical protein